ncbi:hypothetical protein, partial [Ralstonia solanacearum]|uniref:hypothetical protein n=1 Tax=Ralstonia solanacearum TaxID=305 RepID=UPI00066B9767
HPLNASFLPVAGFALAGGSRRSAFSIAWRVGYFGALYAKRGAVPISRAKLPRHRCLTRFNLVGAP